MRTKLALALACLFSLNSILLAQNVTISGNVFGFLGEKVLLVRKASKNVSFEGPISGAKLNIVGPNGLNSHAMTDITGSYSITIVEKGSYSVTVQRDGYSSVVFTVNYKDAGLKTYYPATSFILKKDDQSMNYVGELLISNAGKLTFTPDNSNQKKSSSDVMQSDKILLEKAALINNSSARNVVNIRPTMMVQNTGSLTAGRTVAELEQMHRDDSINIERASKVKGVISTLVSGSNENVSDLKSRIEESKKALEGLDPTDADYQLLKAQIDNAESQLKDKELLIEAQTKEISNSKKMILYLGLFGVFALLSVILLLIFLRERKKHNLELAEKNQKITKMNSRLVSSIRYASIIQSNFFKDKKVLNKLFNSSFIFNQPKDFLSGDFYWFSHKDGHKVVVVADCTGHGVPGALLTILGHSILEEIVNAQGEVLPSRILMGLNKAVMSAFSRSEQLEYGMDITVISMKDDSDEVLFSGMTNGLYHYTNEQLSYFNVTAKTIGATVSEIDLVDQKIKVKAGDCFYLLSDGYCDQFGDRKDVIEKYNVKRLQQLLTKVSSAPNFSGTEAELKTEFDNWKGSRDQIDDVLVVGIRI
jgi:serine phosphatase RsbU (regulator of sigma subunit)